MASQLSPVPLGDYCEDTELCDPRRASQTPFRYIDISGVSNRLFAIAEAREILGKDAPSRAKKRVRKGDVLLATTRPYLKSIALVPDQFDQCVCSTGFSVLRAKRGVPPEWIFYVVQSQQFMDQLLPKMRGASYPAVTDGNVRECMVPKMPPAEQRDVVARIKECLDRVEEMQQLRGQALTEAAALLDALINELLSEAAGTPTRLGSVLTIASALVDPRLPQYRQLLHIGGANIVSGTGELLNLKTAAEEKLISGKYLFTPEDVIYSKIRPRLRKVVRPDFVGLCSADSYPLRPIDDRLNRDFLFYLLLSRKLTDYTIAGSNRAGIPKVNREYLMAFEFDLPEPEVQERIAAKLNKSWNAAKQIASELAQTGADHSVLRESILREAFAGDL